MEKRHKFSIWYVLLGVWVVLIIQSYIASMFAAQTIPYSQFLDLLKTGKIVEVAVTANQIQGKMKVDGGTPGETKIFKTIRVDPELSTLLEQYKVIFKGEIESTFSARPVLVDFPHNTLCRHLVLLHEEDGLTAGRFHDHRQEQGKDICGK